MMAKPSKTLEVRVLREPVDGKAYSAVVSIGEVTPWGDERHVVIDRSSNRGPLNAGTVIERAKLLADLLDVKYSEDLSWPCAAHRGLACRCPKCITNGRA